MNDMTSIKLTDSPSIAIVEHYQRELGDKTAGKTLTRIIQAFHAKGLSLTPEPSPAPTGEHLDVTA